MSIEVIVFLAIAAIVAAVLYARNHPQVVTDLQSRLAELERRSPAAPAPAVDHASVVTAALAGAAQVVSAAAPAAASPPPAVPASVDPAPAIVATPAPAAPIGPLVFDPALGIDAFRKLRDAYPLGTAIVSPRGYPIDVRGQEIVPSAPANFDGADIWKDRRWRIQLDPGASDSRKFQVPVDYTGRVEYAGDNSLKEGFMDLYIGGAQCLGAGGEIAAVAGSWVTVTVVAKANPAAPAGAKLLAHFDLYHG